MELETLTYKPSPVRRVTIPKPGDHGIRLLALPTTTDRAASLGLRLAVLALPRAQPDSFWKTMDWRFYLSPRQSLGIARFRQSMACREAGDQGG